VYYCAADPDVYSPLGPGYGVQDALGRTTTSCWTTSQNALDLHYYAYDRNSNRTWRTSQGTGLNWIYTYDGLDRLDDARRGLGGPGTLTTTNRRKNWETLDTLGNWKAFNVDRDGAGGAGNWELEQSRAHNKVNEIDNDDRHDNAPVSTITASTGSDWVDPVYDAAGNMTSGPMAGMSIETDTEETRLHFTYDAWNRLVKVEDDDGGGEPDDTIAEYRFDGLHRRIAKILPYGSNWNRTDYYYTRSWQVIEERQADDVTTANKENPATTARCQYVWGARYLDDIVLRDRDTDADGDCDDERLFYLTDANFNVVAVTDASANVLENYDYDPYGRVSIYDDDWSSTVAWQNSKKNEILYCGYRFDPETGFYHVRYRMYHPTLGRWQQRDHVRDQYADGLNLYQYVRSAAVNLRDPKGTRVECPADVNTDTGAPWEEVARPSDSDDLFSSIRNEGSWFWGTTWQERDYLRFEWVEAGLTHPVGNCGEALTLTVGFSVTEGESIGIQVGGGKSVSFSGNFSRSWSSTKSNSGGQTYGPTSEYEYMGIALSLSVTKWTQERRPGSDHPALNNPDNPAEIWSDWSRPYYTGPQDWWSFDVKPVYTRGGFLVCRRKCKCKSKGKG